MGDCPGTAAGVPLITAIRDWLESEPVRSFPDVVEGLLDQWLRHAEKSADPEPYAATEQ